VHIRGYDDLNFHIPSAARTLHLWSCERTWVESSMISIMDEFNHRLMEIRRWHPMRYSQN